MTGDQMVCIKRPEMGNNRPALFNHKGATEVKDTAWQGNTKIVRQPLGNP